MSNRVKLMRTGLTILLAGYWLALFVSTHLPQVPVALAMPGADKWEHLAAYAVLAFLLAGRRYFGQSADGKSLGRIAA